MFGRDSCVWDKSAGRGRPAVLIGVLAAGIGQISARWSDLVGAESSGVDDLLNYPPYS